jgi:hypothetical protein
MWDRARKLQPGKECGAGGFDLDFDLHSQLDRAATKPYMRVYAGLQLIWANYPEKWLL